MKVLGVDATARASFALYNTEEEASRLVEAVKSSVYFEITDASIFYPGRPCIFLDLLINFIHSGTSLATMAGCSEARLFCSPKSLIKLNNITVSF